MDQLLRALGNRRVSLPANLIKLDTFLDEPPVIKTTFPLMSGSSLSGLKLRGIFGVMRGVVGSAVMLCCICQRIEQPRQF